MSTKAELTEIIAERDAEIAQLNKRLDKHLADNAVVTRETLWLLGRVGKHCTIQVCCESRDDDYKTADDALRSLLKPKGETKPTPGPFTLEDFAAGMQAALDRLCVYLDGLKEAKEE